MHPSARLAHRRAAAVLATASLVVAGLAGSASAAPLSVVPVSVVPVSVVPTAVAPADDLAPLLLAGTPAAVEGSYLVVLDADPRTERRSGSRAAERARGLGAQVTHTYDTAVAGYAARLSPGQLKQVREDPAVAYVEADQVVSVSDTQSPVTWGLDRTDQRALPLSGSYTYGPTGTGVRAYVIDTGVLGTHAEFSGRMAAGYTAISDGRGTTDCNGHGTHVAGTVAGTAYGIAKRATVVPVRVLGCNGSGTNSGVVAGIDWVAANAVRPAVANMSLGGGASTATDAAVQRAVDRGVTMVVAAGNENQNACNVSPARAVNAITVGSTTRTDARSSFSNFGTCVDVFAPGSEITSAWYTGTSATNTISGTSMASPHVAGAAALYLQTDPSASPAAVTSSLLSSSTTGVVTGAGTGSPNRLLYTASIGGGTTPTPTPTPTPAPTGPCTPATETFSGSLAAGASTTRPSSYYTSTVSGTHAGCLTGPAGTDFDLYLLRWDGRAWVTVASGTGTSSTETVTYSGAAGYYLWQVRAYSGSGAFTLTTRRP